MSKELLPCPFCGGKGKPNWHDGFPLITCDKCQSSTGIFVTGNKLDAIAAWNTRTQPPQETSHDK